MEVNSTPGAESTSLDVWDQKVRGEKAVQKSGGERKTRNRFLYNGGEKERLGKGEGVIVG